MSALILLTTSVCLLADPPRPAAKITYDQHVAPLLRAKCFGCHNQDKKKGGLLLTNYGGLMEGGGSGKVVLPGDPDGSRLYRAMAHVEEPFMPPDAPALPKETLETVRQWIAGGALENAGSVAKVANKPKFDLTVAAASVGKLEGPPPMPGTLPLEPVVRTARANAITALAASPWAPLWAVGGQKQVLLYHAATLDLLGVLPFPEGVPCVLKFSRNGSLLLAGGGQGAKAGRVVVWNVRTGERVFAVGDEFDTVLAADISADQTRIALGGPSKLIRIYSTKDGQLLHEIKKHTDWVTAVEFSPDGVLLATGDRNGGLFVWEAHTGREYFSLRGHTASITDLSWRIDSNVLASCSEDTTIRLWEMENGGQIKGWGAHGGGAEAVKFARDGRLASCGRDRLAKVWDQNGAQQRAFEAFPDVALRIAFNHDASRVVAGDWTGQLRVFDNKDGKPLGNLLANPPTLAEHVEAATKELAARQAAHGQFAAAAAAAQASADKAAAELAAIQKIHTEATAAAKAAAGTVAKAQEAVAKANAALTAAQAAVPTKEAAAKLVADTAAKAQEAADKLKDNKELADFAARGKELAGKAAADLAAARKQATDLTVAVKTATDQLAAAQQTATKVNGDAAAMPKMVEAKQAASKVAADHAAAAKAAASQAAAALDAARAKLARWQAAATAARTQQTSSIKQ